MKEEEKKALKAIEDFIEWEIEDYGGSFEVIDDTVEPQGEYLWAEFTVKAIHKENSILFKAELNDQKGTDDLKVFVSMCDGEIWEEVNTYSNKVKYFWMLLCY